MASIGSNSVKMAIDAVLFIDLNFSNSSHLKLEIINLSFVQPPLLIYWLIISFVGEAVPWPLSSIFNLTCPSIKIKTSSRVGILYWSKTVIFFIESNSRDSINPDAFVSRSSFSSWKTTNSPVLHLKTSISM